MANTRFRYDESREEQILKQATFQGRYMLDTPGNGLSPHYIADPHIRAQKWGGNLHTNITNLESVLLGITQKLNRDCYVTRLPQSKPLQYETNIVLSTDESRVSLPAWTFRDVEQVHWSWLPQNPQQNVFIPFDNNVSSRIVERDKQYSKTRV